MPSKRPIRSPRSPCTPDRVQVSRGSSASAASVRWLVQSSTARGSFIAHSLSRLMACGALTPVNVGDSQRQRARRYPTRGMTPQVRERPRRSSRSATRQGERSSTPAECESVTRSTVLSRWTMTNEGSGPSHGDSDGRSTSRPAAFAASGLRRRPADGLQHAFRASNVEPLSLEHDWR